MSNPTTTETTCSCGFPLTEHIGSKPCVSSPPSTATRLHELSIFGRMWREDGRDRRG